MEQNSHISEQNPNPEQDFLLIPLEMCEFIFHSRKFKAFEVLFHIKLSAPDGILRVTSRAQAELAQKCGIKTQKTLKKHIAWLNKMNLVTIRNGGTIIRHWSLFKRFPGNQSGIRIYKKHPDSFKNQLFQGISAYFIRRAKFINRKSGRLAKKGGHFNSGLHGECTSGVSINYLSTILSYSNVRISQLKKSGLNLKTTHRYELSGIVPADLNHYRNFDPIAGKRCRRTPTGIVRQLIDRFEFTHQPEFGRRKTA